MIRENSKDGQAPQPIELIQAARGMGLRTGIRF
jgi:hypothetical protein